MRRLDEFVHAKARATGSMAPSLLWGIAWTNLSAQMRANVLLRP